MHSRHGSTQFRSSGFTLAELLVALGIDAVLIGILLPAIQRSRDAATRVACASKLRQLSLGVQMYADANQTLPAGCGYPFAASPGLVIYQRAISWQTSILPYVDQNSLWNQAWEANSLEPDGDNSLLFQVMATVVPAFLCPAESRQQAMYLLADGSTLPFGLTSYQGVAGTGISYDDGIFHPNLSVHFTDITDGTSNTIMIGERPPGPDGIPGGWCANSGPGTMCPIAQILPAGFTNLIPSNGVGCDFGSSFRPGSVTDACSAGYYWSFHSGGGNFGFADGSVHFLSYSNSSILPLLATRAGGEVATFD